MIHPCLKNLGKGDIIHYKPRNSNWTELYLIVVSARCGGLGYRSIDSRSTEAHSIRTFDSIFKQIVKIEKAPQ